MIEAMKHAAGRVSARLGAFRHDDDGASTVEMVVMMAAGISLGLSMMDMVTAGVENIANDIGSFLTNIEITTSFDDPAPVTR